MCSTLRSEHRALSLVYAASYVNVPGPLQPHGSTSVTWLLTHFFPVGWASLIFKRHSGFGIGGARLDNARGQGAAQSSLVLYTDQGAHARDTLGGA